MISNNLKLRLITSFFLITLIILLFKYKFILIYSLIVFGVISFLDFSNLINKVILSTVNRLISNTLFLFYVFLFCFLFFLFNSFIQLKFLLFTILLGCVASDIGGFVFGKIFGNLIFDCKKRLTPFFRFITFVTEPLLNIIPLNIF